MKKFSVLVPSTIDEAISLLASHGEGARYIAGGTDVVVKVKEGKLAPDYLVSLRRIPALDRISVGNEKGELRIGALVTHRMLETSPFIRWHYPILHDAVRQIGSVQIRNVATIGGNLVNAVPSADGAIPLVTLEARVVIHGPKGPREVELLHFFLGPGQTILERGEILTEIIVQPLLPRTGSAYMKFGRREAMELPLLGVGVILSLEKESRRCCRARIGLGVAAPTPMRAVEAERFLEGKDVDEALLEEAGRIASEEARVRDSMRGVAWYRREMVRVLVKRMGLKCLEMAEEQGA
jgi:aerobic carbon-monoxide dehydrogenase medium subunit